MMLIGSYTLYSLVRQRMVLFFDILALNACHIAGHVVNHTTEFLISYDDAVRRCEKFCCVMRGSMSSQDAKEEIYGAASFFGFTLKMTNARLYDKLPHLRTWSDFHVLIIN